MTGLKKPRHARSYRAGEKGKNRVRLFEHRSGMLMLEYRDEAGVKKRVSLKHNDFARGRGQADVLAAELRKAGRERGDALTLDALFDIYEREVTPRKAKQSQAHDRRTFALMRQAFGAQRRVETLNRRDWDSYIERRQRGEVAPPRTRGQPVRNRIVEYELKTLCAVLNWAECSRDSAGKFLLDKNPLRGLPYPREQSPSRPVMTADLFARVRAAATEQSSTAELFVSMLWFTGHRAASVRQLRWDEVDFTNELVTWRADVDKIRYAHQTPLHRELVPLLARAHAVAELTGEQHLFPSPRCPHEPMTRLEAAALWRSIANAAGIAAGSRMGTHSFRRAFANRLRDVPLRDLKDAGGWKATKTVTDVYLQPDLDAQRTALERL